MNLSFKAELLGGLESAKTLVIAHGHGDHAAMVIMRLEQSMDLIAELPCEPTAPTQPPAPLAGGTGQNPSTATAEAAAGCKEGRPVSPATAWVPIVVCAALRKEGQLVIGIRHYDPLMRATISATFGSKWWKGAEQGFVNAKGQFLTRQEAHVVAKQNNQIRHRCGGDKNELYSENLY